MRSAISRNFLTPIYHLPFFCFFSLFKPFAGKFPAYFANGEWFKPLKTVWEISRPLLVPSSLFFSGVGNPLLRVASIQPDFSF
jgi:hypothetical protein